MKLFLSSAVKFRDAIFFVQMHHHKQTNLFIPKHASLDGNQKTKPTNKQTNEQKRFRYQHAALPTEPKNGTNKQTNKNVSDTNMPLCRRNPKTEQTNEQKRFRYQHAALPTEPKNGTNKHTNKQKHFRYQHAALPTETKRATNKQTFRTPTRGHLQK